METIMLSGKHGDILSWNGEKWDKTFCRFERNGPNSTLQVDDHKKIVNTPDGEYFLQEQCFQ